MKRPAEESSRMPFTGYLVVFLLPNSLLRTTSLINFSVFVNSTKNADAIKKKKKKMDIFFHYSIKIHFLFSTLYKKLERNYNDCFDMVVNYHSN